MASERVRRQIDRLLDEAEEALTQWDWEKVRDLAKDALALDPGNEDARTFLAAASRSLDDFPADATPIDQEPASLPSDQPTPFSNGRYQVKRFLGKSGKKRVYLTHDGVLDRDVAFAHQGRGPGRDLQDPRLPRNRGHGQARLPSPDRYRLRPR